MNEPRKQTRCAIYTRKSSEEGLEQSFNSLDAQREACEAYILSQKHEGWQVLGSRYDDGGFSGGTMERPGLKKLLSDIVAGKVDTVVVYKVDRLTRSLADFAKIVENFDSKGVSFVSVTQQFNTTTSMGRLTLNVLLSFAQFEREATGERIRDKVAASKRKGMWMGGQVPLGYDLGQRELLVNELEAEQVREIYRQYLRLGSVFDLQEYLQTTDIRSKRRVASTGSVLGGSVLSRGTLYHLLSSPLYLGKVVHKGKVHDGLHQPIVDRQLWNSVAVQLKAGTRKRKQPRNLASHRLLTGLLSTEAGERYLPTHSSKKGRRYFYYTCLNSSGLTARFPALALEELVLARVRQLLCDGLALRELYTKHSVADLRIAIAAGQHVAELLAVSESEFTRSWVRAVVQRVVVTPAAIRFEVDPGALAARLLGREPKIGDFQTPCVLECPLESARRGAQVRLVLEAEACTEPESASLLLKTVARARNWAERIATGEVTSVADLMQHSQLSSRYVRRTLQCASLSPRIIQQIIDGLQTPGLKPWSIAARLPLAWKQQKFMPDIAAAKPGKVSSALIAR